MLIEFDDEFDRRLTGPGCFPPSARLRNVERGGMRWRGPSDPSGAGRGRSTCSREEAELACRATSESPFECFPSSPPSWSDSSSSVGFGCSGLPGGIDCARWLTKAEKQAGPLALRRRVSFQARPAGASWNHHRPRPPRSTRNRKNGSRPTRNPRTSPRIGVAASVTVAVGIPGASGMTVAKR